MINEVELDTLIIVECLKQVFSDQLFFYYMYELYMQFKNQ